jgi:hypothetical protein
MKFSLKTMAGVLLLGGGLLALSSCETDGYVEADTGVYYGGPYYRDPWFHEGPWVYGHPWAGEPRGGRGGAYIHPPRVGHPAPRGGHDDSHHH